MGLGSFSTGGNATYLRIGIGKDEKGGDRAIIGRKAKEGDPGAVQVFKKENEPALDADGKPTFRTEYLFIEGLVSAIERKPGFDEKPDGRLAIHISDSSGHYILQLTKGDDYWLDFALRADNIDFARPVRFTPYSIPDKEQPKFSNRLLVPSVDGEKVMRKYKIKWLREVPADFVQDPNQPPPFIYDSDEGEWRKGKTLRWLDEGPIQRAIDIVAFNAAHPVADEPEAAVEKPAPKTVTDAMVETATAIAKKNDGAPLPQIEDGPGDPLGF